MRAENVQFGMLTNGIEYRFYTDIRRAKCHGQGALPHARLSNLTTLTANQSKCDEYFSKDWLSTLRSAKS